MTTETNPNPTPAPTGATSRDETQTAVELRRQFAVAEDALARVLRCLAGMNAPPGSGLFAVWWTFAIKLCSLTGRLRRAGGHEWARRFGPGSPAPFHDSRVVADAHWPLLDLALIFAHWRPGSYDAPWSWDDEFRDLEARESKQLDDLERSLRALGMTDPIVLGTDGRVWDGHHRLLVAKRIGLERVPVEISDWDERWGLVAPGDGAVDAGKDAVA